MLVSILLFSTYHFQNSSTCRFIFWNVECGFSVSYENNIIANKIVISALPNKMTSLMQGAGCYEGDLREQQTRCGAYSWWYHPSHSWWHVWVDVGFIDSTQSRLRRPAVLTSRGGAQGNWIGVPNSPEHRPIAFSEIFMSGGAECLHYEECAVDSTRSKQLAILKRPWGLFVISRKVY